MAGVDSTQVSKTASSQHPDTQLPEYPDEEGTQI